MSDTGRRFLRFTLRELLLLCVVLGILTGVIAYRVRTPFLQELVNRRIVEAVNRNDEADAVRALEAGANADARSKALSAAVVQQNVRLVEMLLAAGADQTSGPIPPLRDAVMGNNLPIAQRLLAAGAFPGGYDGSGKSLLRVCIERRNLDMLQLLLSAGAAISTTDLAAALSDRAPDAIEKQIVTLLVQHGADMGMLMDFALQEKNGTMADKLVRHYGQPYTAREATALNRLGDLRRMVAADASLPRQ
jgi:ankyrin repeat protein